MAAAPHQRIYSHNREGALLQHLNMTACFWRHLAIGAKACPHRSGHYFRGHCDLIACPKNACRVSKCSSLPGVLGPRLRYARSRLLTAIHRGCFYVMISCSKKSSPLEIVRDWALQIWAWVWIHKAKTNILTPFRHFWTSNNVTVLL